MVRLKLSTDYAGQLVELVYWFIGGLFCGVTALNRIFINGQIKAFDF